MQVGFSHSVFADTYEKQANKQGFTFGKDAKWVQELGKSLITLHIHGAITDSEYDKILKRFSDKILVGHLKPLPLKED